VTEVLNLLEEEEVVAGLAVPAGAWIWPSGIWVTGRPVRVVVALEDEEEEVVTFEEEVVVRMVVTAVVVRVVVVVALVELVVAARVEVVVVVARVLVPVELRLVAEEEVEAGRADMAPVLTPGQEMPPMVPLVLEGA
jgi:hypothetical protein